MASDTSIFNDRRATPEEETPKRVGFRDTDLSLFLRNRQESENKPPENKPKETNANERSDDPGLLPGIGLLAIPGVGPLLAAAAVAQHKQDVKEKEKSDEPSDEAFHITEEHVQQKTKTED